MPNHDGASPGGLVRRPLPQHLDTEALSAYLDDRLDPDARAVATTHLAACQDCRRELAELRTAVDLLHGLPQYRPRRSFQLGPSYARAVHGNRFARFLPLLPALRTATAVCGLLLAMVTAADVLVDEEDAPTRSTENVVVDEVNPAPADAREPTGREPLPDQVIDPDVDAEAPASDAGAVDSDTSDAAADEAPVVAESEDGAEAPAPAPDSASRSAAGPVSDEAGGEAGLADAAAGETGGGALTTSAAVNTDSPAASVGQGETGDRLSAWQVAQLGLGLVLATLVAALVILQRLANRARRLDPGF